MEENTKKENFKTNIYCAILHLMTGLSILYIIFYKNKNFRDSILIMFNNMQEEATEQKTGPAIRSILNTKICNWGWASYKECLNEDRSWTEAGNSESVRRGSGFHCLDKFKD